MSLLLGPYSICICTAVVPSHAVTMSLSPLVSVCPEASGSVSCPQRPAPAFPSPDGNNSPIAFTKLKHPGMCLCFSSSLYICVLPLLCVCHWSTFTSCYLLSFYSRCIICCLSAAVLKRLRLSSVYSWMTSGLCVLQGLQCMLKHTVDPVQILLRW